MKRDFSKHGHHEKVDKVDKKAAYSGAVKKEKGTKKRLSIYDDFDDEDMDDFDYKSFKNNKLRR